MRMINRHFCLLAALLIALATVAVPATAFGQSAGDDQYVDPFQNNVGDGKDNSQNSNSQSDTTSGSQQTTQSTAGDTAGTTASDPAEGGNTLPRTGEDVGGLVLMGVALLGGGFALRRAWPLPD
jgi:LPXTG-motif cell wall-anchored protein